MGGPERLAKHHSQGKLDARARIDALVDPGSFLELGTLTGGDEAPAEAIVLGSAKVSGRPLIVAAEDFTVMAGTISHTANSKRYRAAELALRDRVPLVMMLDGAGFRADGKAYGKSPTDLLSQSRCSGYVPLITAVLGSSAGHGALVAPHVRLLGDEPARGDLHRRPAGGRRVAGREGHQGGARWSGRRDPRAA